MPDRLIPVFDPDLLTAGARSRQIESILRVVDESLERSAELREAREARRSEERAEAVRRRRAEEAERVERRDAERVAAHHREEAEAIVADRAALRAAEVAAENREAAASRGLLNLVA